MCPLVPTLNCVKLEDYLFFPVTIHTICMVLFMPTKTFGTHAATCDRVVLVYLTPFIIISGRLITLFQHHRTLLAKYRW